MIKKNKGLKGCLITSVFLLSAAFFLLFVMLISGAPTTLVPNVEDDYLSELQRKSDACGVPWDEVLAYTTVKYENEFDHIDLDSVVAKFIIVRYKEYKEVEKTITKRKKINGEWVKVQKTVKEWVLKKEKTLETPNKIYSFARSEGISTSQPIEDIIAGINELDDTEQYDIFISHKEVRDFFDEFNDDQIEWYTTLMEENVIAIVYGEHYDLPESLIVETSGFFTWPTPGVRVVTSPFGRRTDPVYGGTGYHHGVDAASNSCAGKPIIAAADGRVITTQYKTTGYGYNVMIEHVDNEGRVWQTRYAHMNQIEVEIGENVSKGDVIGAIGNTGKSTGAHIHFEIRLEGTPVDPLLFVNPY